MLYYQEMAQRAIEFSKLCKFDPFCSIPRARLAIFWKYDMFEDIFFGLFKAYLLTSRDIFVFKHILLPGNGPKSSQILNTVQF